MQETGYLETLLNDQGVVRVYRETGRGLVLKGKTVSERAHLSFRGRTRRYHPGERFDSQVSIARTSDERERLRDWAEELLKEYKPVRKELASHVTARSQSDKTERRRSN